MPDEQPALNDALAKFRAGDLTGAEQVLETVRGRDPRNFEATHLLAGVRRQSGDPLGALALFDDALAINPDSAQAQANRANLLFELSRYEEAVSAYEAALMLRPDHAPSWLNRGRALHGLGKPLDALASIAQAMRCEPSQGNMQRALGAVLAELGRYREAVEALSAALSERPGDPSALFERGNALRMLEQRDEALADYDAALVRAPDNADAWRNRGVVLHALERLDEALSSLDRALTLRPGDPEIANDRGAVLSALGRYDEAIVVFSRVLAEHPGFPGAAANRAAAHYSKAIALLADGAFEEAWPLYELRRVAAAVDTTELGRGQRQWRGEKLVGVLHVWTEQDLGDVLVFANLLPLARERADRIVLECDARLAPLLRRSFPWLHDVCDIRSTAAIGDIEAQISIASLGFALGVTRGDIENLTSYLKPDPARVGEVRRSYEARTNGRPIIGIALDAPADSSAVLREDAFFVTLQDADPLLDLDGYAAQIAALDRIVASPNLTAHLAGAIGVPCIVHASADRAWHWGKADRTPWYKNLSLVSQ